jgi:sulfoxide reductase heme-binding subunit YedZ
MVAGGDRSQAEPGLERARRTRRYAVARRLCPGPENVLHLSRSLLNFARQRRGAPGTSLSRLTWVHFPGSCAVARRRRWPCVSHADPVHRPDRLGRRVRVRMTRTEATALKTVAAFLTMGVLVLLAFCGPGEDGVREVIRWTARSSLVFLCAALVTEGARRPLPPWGQRSVLLRSLGLSHTFHAVAIAILAVQIDGRNLLERSAPLNVFGGALAYGFIYWGALKPYSRLTSAGLVWIWGVFMFSYGTRALRLPMPFGFAVGLLLVAMLLRIAGSPSVGRRPEAMIRE